MQGSKEYFTVVAQKAWQAGQGRAGRAKWRPSLLPFPCNGFRGTIKAETFVIILEPIGPLSRPSFRSILGTA